MHCMKPKLLNGQASSCLSPPLAFASNYTRIKCRTRLWAVATPAGHTEPPTVGNRRSRTSAANSAPADTPSIPAAATSTAGGKFLRRSRGIAESSGGESKRGGGSGDGAAGGKGDWRKEVLVAFAETEGFAELTIRAKDPSAQPWHTITVRPVSLRGSRHLQVTTFTARQSTAANHPAPPGDAAALEGVLAPLLAAAGLGSVSLRTPGQDLAVQITKRGKGIVHRSAPQGRAPLVAASPGRALSHDRAKALPIPGNTPHPFLQRIGFQAADGRIRANMQDKFSQVNEFLKLLGHTGLLQELREAAGEAATAAAAAEAAGVAAAPQSPSPSPSVSASEPAVRPSAPSPSSPPSGPRRLHILDCGCGSSHLSFGTYHYLNNVLGIPAAMTGVDVNAGLMAKANANADALGVGESVRFVTAPIGGFSPPSPPDIVLALHACDTATDDALALAVQQAAPLIMAVPCCHAALHKQLSGLPPSARPPWAPLLRHGILRQRQLDLLTDTLRATLLRVAGYRTDVVEFVSTEHTPRNLLIRAVRQSPRPRREDPPAAASAVRSRESSAPSPPSTATSQPPPPARQEGDGDGGSGDGCGTGRSGNGVGVGGGVTGFSRQQLAAAREYIALRDYWGVTPQLEVLLSSEVGPVLRAAVAAGAAAAEGSEAGEAVGGEAPGSCEGEEGEEGEAMT